MRKRAVSGAVLLQGGPFSGLVFAFGRLSLYGLSSMFGFHVYLIVMVGSEVGFWCC